MSSVFMLFDYPLEFGKMSHSSKIPNLQWFPWLHSWFFFSNSLEFLLGLPRSLLFCSSFYSRSYTEWILDPTAICCIFLWPGFWKYLHLEFLLFHNFINKCVCVCVVYVHTYACVVMYALDECSVCTVVWRTPAHVHNCEGQKRYQV